MMKQLLVACSIIFISLNVTAQLTKKTWLFGGSGSYYSYNEKYIAPSVSFTGKYASLDLTASVGYFFVDKFTAGLRPYLSIYKGNSSGGATPYDFKLAAGPFIRYYFLKKDKQFNLLADASYQFGINQSKTGSEHPKGKFNIFSIMAGAEVFFNSAVGIEILLGYKNQIASFENTPSAYTSKRSGLLASIGFQFHLTKD